MTTCTDDCNQGRACHCEKPTVRYQGKPYVEGGRAWLKPIDHPNHLEGHSVSNTNTVMTSRVIYYDRDSGRIETMNTIYVPEEPK